MGIAATLALVVTLVGQTELPGVALSASKTESRFLDAEGNPKCVDGCDDWRSGAVKIGGDLYTHSIYDYDGFAGLCSDDTDAVEWDLGREWTTFRTTLGLRDDSDSQATIVMEVFGDGEQLAEETVELGDQTPVRIDVSGMLRLRLSATSPSDDYSGCDVYPAFGKALVARPKPKEVARKLTLVKSGHKLVGRLTAHKSQKCRAKRAIRIQEKSFGHWNTERRTKTDSSGGYEVRAKGLYDKIRALSPMVEFGEDVPKLRCLRAKSDSIRL